MQFVLLLDAAQDGDGVFHAGFADKYRLEAPRQGGVLFHVLAVLVQRGGADTMQRPARQFRLDEVGGIHCPVRLAGADQRVHLIDEQDHFAGGGLDFLQHGLQPFLEFSPVFRPRHHGAQIQCQKLLAFQRLRHVAIDDA